MPSDELEQSVGGLVSRAAITDALRRYARLIDEGDFDAVADIFADDCTADYGIREGDMLCSPAGVVEWIKTQLRRVRATSHHISNIEIDFIDNDHAASVCYVYAWHSIDGMEVNMIVLGRYLDRFERADDKWRIRCRRLFVHGLEHFPADVLRPLPRPDDTRPNECLADLYRVFSQDDTSDSTVGLNWTEAIWLEVQHAPSPQGRSSPASRAKAHGSRGDGVCRAERVVSCRAQRACGGRRFGSGPAPAVTGVRAYPQQLGAEVSVSVRRDAQQCH